MFFNLLRATSTLLLAALLAGGIEQPAESQPTADMQTVKETVEAMDEPTYAAATAELSLRLLRLTNKTPTRMVSALSLSEALTLLAEGASGETLAELEGAIGLPLDELRRALPAFLETLPSNEKAVFRSANSIWTEKDGFILDKDYAARIQNAYHAELNAISFNAPDASDQINGWVSNHTDGMIDGIVDDNSVRNLTMLLVNALCFDAKWQIPFEAQTSPRTFTCADGSAVQADFMTSAEYEDSRLIERDGTIGFVKPYAGGDYSFVALLPPEGVALDDYLTKMSGADFVSLVTSADRFSMLRIRMPRFKLDYSVTLNETLRSLGVKRIFDGNLAELSGLGNSAGSLYVDSVLQKTHIDVDTEGTRAAAVTAIFVKTTAVMPPVKYREIELNRPFLYAIVENVSGTPLFIGTVAELESAD